MKKQLIDWFWRSGSVPVDYSPLYAYFDKAVNIAESGSAFTDVARTTAATDGTYVKNITEILDGTNLSWVSSAIRKSYLAQKFASRYNFQAPVYKNPSGDKPHITFPNMLDTQFSSSSFSAASSPNTMVAVIRSRRAVPDEGGVGMGLFARDRSADHLEISNSAGAVELDAASGIPTYQQIKVLLIEDNGASSKLFINNVQVGTNETLAAGSISQLFYGTTSHQWEHDLFFAGVHYGIFSSGERSALQTLIESYFSVSSGPNAPYLHNAVLAFDGTDTFTVSSVTFNDPNSAGENTSLREYEWFVNRSAASVDGYTGLDGQYAIHRGTTLKRGDHPDVFLAGATGTGVVQVAVRIKGYDNNGNSWSGIPFRSLFINDNIAGTPVTTNQCWIQSVTVEDATPTKIRVHLTSSAGGGTFSGGNANHFKVWVNGVETSFTADFTGLVASGNIDLTLTNPLTYSDDVVVNHIPDATTPLQNSTGFTVPLQSTGAYLAFTNNIVGPITIKVNLSQSVDGTSPPWNNANVGGGGVATLIANLNDDGGAATGISLAITEAGQGWTGSDYGSAGTLFDETNVTQRGAGVWQGGNTNTTLRFAGLSAGQTFDISYAIAKIGNGGVGNVVINGGTPIAFNSSSYTEFTQTGLTADGSGNVDITMTITGSGDEAALIGIILTTYP
jgi:hypothetical protein